MLGCSQIKGQSARLLVLARAHHRHNLTLRLISHNSHNLAKRKKKTVPSSPPNAQVPPTPTEKRFFLVSDNNLSDLPNRCSISRIWRVLSHPTECLFVAPFIGVALPHAHISCLSITTPQRGDHKENTENKQLKQLRLKLLGQVLISILARLLPNTNINSFRYSFFPLPAQSPRKHLHLSSKTKNSTPELLQHRITIKHTLCLLQRCPLHITHLSAACSQAFFSTVHSGQANENSNC